MVHVSYAFKSTANQDSDQAPVRDNVRSLGRGGGTVWFPLRVSLPGGRGGFVGGQLENRRYRICSSTHTAAALERVRILLPSSAAEAEGSRFYRPLNKNVTADTRASVKSARDQFSTFLSARFTLVRRRVCNRVSDSPDPPILRPLTQVQFRAPRREAILTMRFVTTDRVRYNCKPPKRKHP